MVAVVVHHIAMHCQYTATVNCVRVDIVLSLSLYQYYYYSCPVCLSVSKGKQDSQTESGFLLPGSEIKVNQSMQGRQQVAILLK